MTTHRTTYPITLYAGREVEIEAIAHYTYEPAGCRLVDLFVPNHCGGNDDDVIDIWWMLSGEQVEEIQRDLAREHEDMIADERAAAEEARAEARREFRRDEGDGR